MYRDRTHLQVLELQGVQKGLLVGRVKTLLQHEEWFFLLNNRNATEEVGEGRWRRLENKGGQNKQCYRKIN